MGSRPSHFNRRRSCGGGSVSLSSAFEQTNECFRFGHDEDPICMQQDEVLCSIAEEVKLFCVIYLVDISEVSSCMLRVIFYYM